MREERRSGPARERHHGGRPGLEGAPVVKPTLRNVEAEAMDAPVQSAGSGNGVAGAVPLLRVAICGNIANDEVAPVMGPQGPRRCNV